MATNTFISTLLCLVIGLDTLVTEPTFSTAFSVPSSSPLDSLPIDTLSTETDQLQQIENPNNNNNNKNKQNNSNNSNGNNIHVNGNKSTSGITIDEQNAVDITKEMCKLSEFKCSDGSCIPLMKFCDGLFDCLDKSDELSGCSGKNFFF